jgi:putative copper resistance protein D
MTEAVAAAARWAHLAARLALSLLPEGREPALAAGRAATARTAPLLAAIAMAGAAASLASQVASVELHGSTAETATKLLLHSRYGHVWLVRGALMCLLLAGASATRGRAVRGAAPVALLGIAIAALAAGPWSGHAAAEEPAWPPLLAHGVHVTALSLWLGALPALLSLLRADDAATRAAALALFRRFSSIAAPLMAAIVASGLWLALLHVERWPALFGTRYGVLLLAKCALLAGAIALAARLRWRRLPVARRDAMPAALARTLLAETVLGFAILALGALLAQTIPARHDAIEWVLPWRVSLEAAAETPGATASAAAWGVAAAILAVAVVMLRRRPIAAAALAAAALAAGSVAVGTLGVPAYPDTYRKPTVAYQAVSVAEGMDLYRAHCAARHGDSGHGNGPLAADVSPPPANLTEPHTALHTAGDIFWWLTHGKPGSAMPGFADRLSEDGRWDLINYLRTLSVGYQARVLSTQVVPGQAWAGVPDFDFVTTDGRGGTLRDFRDDRPVLLLLHSRTPLSAARAAELAAALEGEPVQILAITADGRTGDDFPAAAWQVTEDAQPVARTLALFRRTLRDADPRDAHPLPAHLELLVDRFGYLRARWLPGEDERWREPAFLREQVRRLATEPKLREPPDEHAH